MTIAATHDHFAEGQVASYQGRRFEPVETFGIQSTSYIETVERRDMKKLIDAKKTPSAVGLLLEASKGFGISDGHAYAANCVLPAKMKHALIENAERVIQGR